MRCFGWKIIMSFQDFLFAVNCICPKALSIMSWILQTSEIKPITESFWGSRIFKIDSSWSTYYIHFGSSQPLVSLKITVKNKNCCLAEQGILGHHTNKFKKGLNLFNLLSRHLNGHNSFTTETHTKELMKMLLF